MVNQGAPKATRGAIGQRTVQQIAVEKDNGTGFDLNGNGVLIFVGKAKGFLGTIKARILLIVGGPDNALFVRARNDPEATIFDGGIIQRNPAADQGAVARGDKIFVLVPGLARFAGGLDKKHGLHALDVWPDYAGEHIHHVCVSQIVVHDGGNFVGKVNADIAAQEIFGIDLQRYVICHFQTTYQTRPAPTNSSGLGAQLFDFGQGQGVFVDIVALFLVEFSTFGWRKAHRALLIITLRFGNRIWEWRLSYH